jgi:hypothetical protein
MAAAVASTTLPTRSAGRPATSPPAARAPSTRARAAAVALPRAPAPRAATPPAPPMRSVLARAAPVTDAAFTPKDTVVPGPSFVVPLGLLGELK